MVLHEALAQKVAAWRLAGYASDAHPAIGEILEWASGTADSGNVRFLRAPQLRALETYWYLRLVEKTPHILTLYRSLFGNGRDLMEALGLTHQDLKDRALDIGIDGLINAVRTDDSLVKKYKLEALRETLALDYPSYILALAMGAGKTILIGAIVATEFAMAMEYPDGDFVQNALIFAPGKTPIESLRELLSAPYEQILPARMHTAFAASVKFTFTRDGEKDIPVIRGSLFNVVVTNTEKIRIQKESILKSQVGTLFSASKADEARGDVANARLQAIASLPHLGIFSDEAHHTYGQSLNTELKKVRKTVDYLHQQTNLICVVNTTGTPYFENQSLKDVVIWYGLSQGIRDNILKDLSDNIHEIDLGDDTGAYVRHVVTSFFKDYGNVALPNGAPAKLAIYFPQTDDLQAFRPAIELAIAEAGYSPSLVLVNTSDSSMTSEADIASFNRLNDPAAPHRVVLLVNKGTEGWNCPSLFACALARKLKTSNNFVLQAASRCLRQVPGNTTRARIYLSKDNHAVLDKQLRETYGENIADLNCATQQTKRRRLVLRKSPIAPIRLNEPQRQIVRRPVDEATSTALTKPAVAEARATARVLSPTESRTAALREVSASLTIDTPVATIDVFRAASDLAARYRHRLMPLVDELSAIYADNDVPVSHLPGLAKQLEDRTRRYDTISSMVEREVFLVKESGFHSEADASGRTLLVTEIAWSDDEARYLMDATDQKENRLDFGFHYNPMQFDSQPERSLFEKVLHELNVKPQDIEDVYFTGGLTDPAKTDLAVEYRDLTGKVRHYTPDFVIRKKPDPGHAPGSGRVLIVEVKREKDRDDAVDGAHGRKAQAVRRWEELNPDRVRYEMVFTPRDTVTYDQLAPIWSFLKPDPITLPIPIDRSALAAFCKKWHVQELSVFGSVLRSDFHDDSDVDFLVTFEPGTRIGLEIVSMTDQLSAIVGRRVDLVTRRSIEASDNWIRRTNILSTARPLYVQ